MIKKFARWVLRGELATLKEDLAWERDARHLWKGRYRLLAVTALGDACRQFPMNETFQGRPV